MKSEIENQYEELTEKKLVFTSSEGFLSPVVTCYNQHILHILGVTNPTGVPRHIVGRAYSGMPQNFENFEIRPII